MTTVFSPRATTSGLLTWYAAALAATASSAHITGAFGLHRVFRDELGIDRDACPHRAARPANRPPTCRYR